MIVSPHVPAATYNEKNKPFSGWPTLAMRRVVLSLGLAGGLAVAAAAGEEKGQFPSGYIDSVIHGQKLELTLPNGRPLVGSIDGMDRDATGITRVKGTITHPEQGAFLLERQHGQGQRAMLKGTLSLDGQATEWQIKPVEASGTLWQWVESPAEDGFRPRQMQLPAARPANVPSPEAARAGAEDALRKDLDIEPLENGNLRVGSVEVDKKSREVRIPATVNMTAGTVEYALVTNTGKCHESLFSTAATPRDIHVAMLLLGVKPAAMGQRADRGLVVPDNSAVQARAEWADAGKQVSHPLAGLVLVMPVPAPEARQAGLMAPWLYNGSRFTNGGFAATIEGSIIALMTDDMALINNACADRVDDESHVPDTNLLPKPGTPATIVLAASVPTIPQVVPSPAAAKP